MFKPNYVKSKPKAYNDGLKTEAAVLNFLAVHYAPCTVVKSEPHDDIIKDIDGYLDGCSLSIKADNRSMKTGNLCFELEVSKGGDDWENSHYYKPKDFYLFVVGRTLYLINYDALKRFIDENGWFRKTQLTKKTVSSQLAMGHKHVNAKLGLLRIKDLVRDEVACVVTNNFVQSDWLIEG